MLKRLESVTLDETNKKLTHINKELTNIKIDNNDGFEKFKKFKEFIHKYIESNIEKTKIKSFISDLKKKNCEEYRSFNLPVDNPDIKQILTGETEFETSGSKK